jgi:hypothetical protein
MAVDISIADQRFGHLVTAYSDASGHRIIAYCDCGRQVHVASTDLYAGTITSCGCRRGSRQFHERHAELRAQLQREIVFTSALRR